MTGILTCFAKVTEPVIAASPRLRVVGRTGVGTNNIDVDACTRRGIPVTYVPDYAIEEVADHAMALLMAFARKIVALDRLTKAGRWETKPARPIHRLRGRTLGILGYGRIGHALARALSAGWIAGAGIDVLEAEPPPDSHPLPAEPNAIVTPHAAFMSEESVLELERRAAQAVVRVLQGRMPEFIWNREVLEQMRLAED